MDRVSDEQLNVLIEFAAMDVAEAPGPVHHTVFLALTELRDRRQASEAPCPEHAKMVADPFEEPYGIYNNNHGWRIEVPLGKTTFVLTKKAAIQIKNKLENAINRIIVNEAMAEKTIDKDGA